MRPWDRCRAPRAPPSDRRRWGSRHLDHLEDTSHDLLARDLLGLGLVRERDAMAEHVRPDRLHVLGRDVAAVTEERVRARGESERDRRARARAVLDEALQILHAAVLR